MTDPIPVCRPWLPTVGRLIPHLRRIDAARYYTNHGQLHDELLRRLARQAAGCFTASHSTGPVLAPDCR